VRHWFFGVLALLSSPVMAQQPVAEIAFESIPDPLKFPTDLYFGEATGVAVNSQKHVFVFSRGNTTGPAYAASAAQLLEFGPDGQFIREIGKNLYAWSFAHAVRIDKDDNIWAIDKGSDMIIRFNPEGCVTMVFGRKQEGSDESTGPLKHPIPRLPAEDGGSGNQQMSRLVPRATSSSAMDISTPASPRPTRMEAGSNLGVIAAITLESSTRHIILEPIRRAGSTSRIAAIVGFKCSTARAISCASSRSMSPLTKTRGRRSVTNPT